MKLKTLESLKEGCGQCNGTCERCQDGMRTDEELDKEGIFCKNPKVDYKKLIHLLYNWLKVMDSDEKFGARNNTDLENYFGHQKSIKNWIKHFGNIKEKDLDVQQ